MKIHTNHTVIKRNSRIGMVSAFSAPILLLVGAQFITAERTSQLIALGLITLGFVSFQMGIVFRRYGQGAEVRFEEGLKKLGGEYHLFNFVTPAAHLLAGPAGIWVLVPRYLRGTLVYNEKRRRWKIRRDTFVQRVFGPLFGALGRPDLDFVSDTEALDHYLRKHWPHEWQPHVDGAIVVMNEEGQTEAANAPLPTLRLNKLAGFLLEQQRNNKMSASEIRQFIEHFTAAE